MANTILKVVKKPVFFVLLFALVLRLWGITYGFPLFLVNDETPLVYGALKMIELKTLIPALHQEEFKKVLYYAPLPSYFFLLTLSPVIAVHYVFSGAPSLADYKDVLTLDPSFLWIAARVLIALIGVVDIFIMFCIAKRLWKSERAALFSALFLALSFWHLQLSHNVRHWLPAAFLLTLVWYAALRISQGNVEWKWYFGGGVLLGLATGGVNTAAAIGLIPLVLAHVRNSTAPLWRRLFDKKILVLLFVFVLVTLLFVILYPYGLTRAEGAAGATDDVLGRFAMLGRKSFSGLVGFIGEYIGTLWRFETPLFLTALGGMLLLLWRKRREWAAATSIYIFSFFSLLYFFDDYTARGLIFVVPLLAVSAGYFADHAWEKLRNLEIKKLSPRLSQFLYFFISIFFFLALFGWQFMIDIRYDWLLSQKDTRLVAQEWISKNISAGSRILADVQYMRIQNTKEGIRALEALDPSGIRTGDRVLLATSDERYPKPAYRILNLNFVSPDIRARMDADALGAEKFQYLVIEYATPENIRSDIRAFTESAHRIAHIDPWKTERRYTIDGSGKMPGISLDELFGLQRLGPFVDIYEL